MNGWRITLKRSNLPNANALMDATECLENEQSSIFDEII